MLLPEEIMKVAAMVAGLLVQNYAEWRSGGPTPPRTVLFPALLPIITDRTRLLALVIVSVAVPLICLVSLLNRSTWSVVAIAAALVVNAVAQLASSLLAKKVQPGTFAGLIFMLPPSLWVILAFGNRSDWTPIAIGPLLSVPLLIGIWWLADIIGRGRA